MYLSSIEKLRVCEESKIRNNKMAKEIPVELLPRKAVVGGKFKYYEPLLVEQIQDHIIESKIEPTDSLETHPYEFVIPAVKDAFLILNNMTLYVKFKINLADGEERTQDNGRNVAVINNFLSSMWKKITLQVNNDTIGIESANDIGYKSMIETMLSYEDEYKQHVYSSLFNSDNAGKHELTRTGVGSDTNPGYNRRFQYTNNAGKPSVACDACGPICVDFLRADNHLAPENTLTLTFERAEDKFCLMSPDANLGFQIEILDLAIYCQRTQVDPSKISRIVDPRKHQRYLTSYSEIKVLSLITGTTQIAEMIIDDETIPKQIIVAMVDSMARAGTYTSNPYNFKHYDLDSIALLVNGVALPAFPLKPDFANGLFMREYHHLFAHTGKMLTSSRGMLITPEMFAAGYSIFPFDLTPDRCNSFHSHVGKVGKVQLDIGWKTPLTNAVDVLVYISSDQIITINPLTKDCKSSVY